MTGNLGAIVIEKLLQDIAELWLYAVGYVQKMISDVSHTLVKIVAVRFHQIVYQGFQLLLVQNRFGIISLNSVDVANHQEQSHIYVIHVAHLGNRAVAKAEIDAETRQNEYNVVKLVYHVCHFVVGNKQFSILNHKQNLCLCKDTNFIRLGFAERSKKTRAAIKNCYPRS